MYKCDAPKLKKLLDAEGNWDGSNYVLEEDWYILFKNDRITLELTVKAGFITDGGSIPWWYRWRLDPVGKYLIAYLVHDAIYASEYLTRSEADWILLEIIEELGGNWVIRNEVYLAVRWGGSDVWKAHTTESIANGRSLIHGKYESSDTSFEFGGVPA